MLRVAHAYPSARALSDALPQPAAVEWGVQGRAGVSLGTVLRRDSAHA
jgi:hypothetical protein